MAIELRDVTFAYPNGYVANENLNLTIPDGELLAIVGQNGAGKTTAVKLMNGLNKPTKGDVLVDGVNTREKSCAYISKTVGYVFQNPDDQIFNSTALAEIEYMPRYMKLSEEEVKRRSSRAIEMTGISSYLKMNQLDIPYAIRKFVAIAAIIATEPKYLILDEPTAGQDKRGNETLESIIRELKRDGTSVIAITHDMDFVAKNFPRIVAMAHKNIIADGTAKEIFWNAQIVEESRIKKPQIAQVAERLKLPGNILFREELTDALR
nr:energy-coupling factor ABC transporter ATP-binding protein [uncultured Faecalicatena sp.]